MDDGDLVAPQLSLLLWAYGTVFELSCPGASDHAGNGNLKERQGASYLGMRQGLRITFVQIRPIEQVMQT